MELYLGPSGRGLIREAGGRKEEAGGQARLPLDRKSREAGCSGPVTGSDLWPKQTCLRGLGAVLSLHRWNQRQTGTQQGPAVTLALKLSKTY